MFSAELGIKEIKKALQRHDRLPRALYGHPLEVPSHNFLQKVRDWVDQSTRLRVESTIKI
jgi:hypothetical protein